MCERHSFCITRAAKVLDGYGLTDSHTTIMDMHGLTAAQHDACNLYEWQPPAEWPIANWADGLKVDRGVFETKLRHDQAAERHVRNLYPHAATWAAPDVIRWSELPLPDAERVHRAYDLALRAAPLGIVDDATVLEHVNRHLAAMGCKDAVEIVDATASVRASVRASVWNSVWNSVWASVRDSVWDGVWASVWASMVREDAENPWLPLSELATHGAYLYGVADDGTAYVWRGGES